MKLFRNFFIVMGVFFIPFLKGMEQNEPLIIRNSGNFTATVNVVHSNGQVETVYNITKPITPFSDVYVQSEYKHVRRESVYSQDDEQGSFSELHENNQQVDEAEEVSQNQESYQDQLFQRPHEAVKDRCDNQRLHQDRSEIKKIEKKLTWKSYAAIVGIPLAAIAGIWYGLPLLKKILF